MCIECTKMANKFLKLVFIYISKVNKRVVNLKVSSYIVCLLLCLLDWDPPFVTTCRLNKKIPGTSSIWLSVDNSNEFRKLNWIPFLFQFSALGMPWFLIASVWLTQPGWWTPKRARLLGAYLSNFVTVRVT